MRHKSNIYSIYTQIFRKQHESAIKDYGFLEFLGLSRASLCVWRFLCLNERRRSGGCEVHVAESHLATSLKVNVVRPGRRGFGVPTRVTGTSDKTGNGIRPEAMPLPWSPGLLARTRRNQFGAATKTKKANSRRLGRYIASKVQKLERATKQTIHGTYELSMHSYACTSAYLWIAHDCTIYVSFGLSRVRGDEWWAVRWPCFFDVFPFFPGCRTKRNVYQLGSWRLFTSRREVLCRLEKCFASVTNQKTRKRYKKGSNSDKANQKKKDVFSFYFIVGLNFLLKKTCVRLNFHLLEHFATRTLRCSAFSYRFDFRLLSSLHVGTKCQTWHLTMDDQAVGDHWITGSLITGSGQLVQICDKPSAGA